MQRRPGLAEAEVPRPLLPAPDEAQWASFSSARPGVTASWWGQRPDHVQHSNQQEERGLGRLQTYFQVMGVEQVSSPKAIVCAVECPSLSPCPLPRLPTCSREPSPQPRPPCALVSRCHFPDGSSWLARCLLLCQWGCHRVPGRCSLCHCDGCYLAAFDLNEIPQAAPRPANPPPLPPRGRPAHGVRGKLWNVHVRPGASHCSTLQGPVLVR